MAEPTTSVRRWRLIIQVAKQHHRRLGQAEDLELGFVGAHDQLGAHVCDLLDNVLWPAGWTITGWRAAPIDAAVAA